MTGATTARSRRADRPLRLLFLIGGLGPGGAERQAVLLLEGLGRHGVQPVLACFGGYEEDFERLRRAGVPVVRLRASGGRLWPLAVWNRLARVMARERIDLVQSFLTTFDVLAPTLRLARPGVRIVTSRRNVSELFRPRDLRLVRLASRWADAVVGNSQAVLESIRRLERHPERKLVCIPNGYDLPVPVSAEERMEARRRLDLPADAFVIAYPAHFRPEKRHDRLPPLLSALRESTPGAIVALAGDAELTASYRAVAARARAAIADAGVASMVRWLGVVREVRSLYAAADVVLSVSEREGMSNVMMEAMAHGRPVVSTRTGGTEELIRDGANGYLVDGDDPKECAARLAGLAGDEDRRRRMGEAARVDLGAGFSVDQMVARYAALYRRLAGRA